MSSNKEKIIVGAIDLGKTYSGYAFSFKNVYEKNPTKVSINHAWNSEILLSLKQPTCVLCNQKGEFHSFGYEAEDKYADLALTDEHYGWYFFRQFKTVLYEKQITIGIEVEDEKGLKMRAATVFQIAIRYLKEHLLRALHTLEEMKTRVKVDDIHWILTVPAICTDSAKNFMRDAAMMAGIDVRNLTIALEPEAAVMYCQLLPSDHLSSKERFDDKKYIVIDLGGETVDITAHEKQDDGTINEVFKASCKGCGGAKVNENFIQMIIKIIGAPAFTRFCKENMADYLEMCREFEIKKRMVHMDTHDTIMLHVPVTLNEAYEKKSGETIKDAIEQSPYRGKIVFHYGKMRLDAELFRSLFENCVSKITQYLLELLPNPVVREFSTLLMVGGFSECQLIQIAVMRTFPNLKIVKPVEAELAVLKGAAILGHKLAKQAEDDVSSDDIANLSKCSNTYDQDNHHDWPKDLNSKSLGEDEQELSSSDSVGMIARRQDEDTAALENRLENQMTLKADVKRSPSDDELFTLSRKLDTFNKGWWLLAKLLGLSDDKIDELEHGGADIIRQYYKMLTAWRNQNTGQEKGSVGYLLRQCDEAGIDREVTLSVFGN